MGIYRGTCAALAILLSFHFALAQKPISPAARPVVKKAKRPQPRAITSKRTLEIKYTNPDWNLNSTEVDSTTVILRDKKSGKSTQVSLQESAPDSGQFVGLFGITWADTASELEPELFLPPRDLVDRPGAGKILQAMMAQGEIAPKPSFFYENEKGQQVLDVFDSPDQVEAARKMFSEEKESRAQTTSGPKPKVIRDKLAESVFEADQLAQIEAERRRTLTESAKREAERQKMMQLEQQKAEERRKAMQALATEERQKRKAQAVKLGDEALKLYEKGSFLEAEKRFAKSIELDSENSPYYYAYGVTLYRNGKFNESLVMLELSKVSGSALLERDFYLGLNLYRLKEYPKAAAKFNKVRASKDKKLGPSAAFYMGLMEFDQTHYELSKPYFQDVLDTSEDPKLDEQAENYIEKIEQLLEFARNKAKKFFLSATAGGQYDSNILLVSDSTLDQAPPSNVGDMRLQGGLGIQWRPLFEKTHEFSVKWRSDIIYTLKTDFSQADPILHNVSAPYVYKGMLFGKGYRAEVKPGYEMLYLDANADGTKESYMNSVTTDLMNTFIMNENWFSAYNLKIRSDAGVSDSSVNAMKYTLNLNNIYFFNKKKSRGIVGDVSYTMNNANGAAYKYNRYDLGAIYIAPFPWDIQFNGGLTYYSANYTDSSPSRQDTDYTLLTGLTKTLTPWLSATASGSYTINNSTVNTYAYKKYTAGIALNAEWGF